MELQIKDGDVFSRFVTERERKTWKMYMPMLYKDKDYGDIVVPQDFDTDFASIQSLRPNVLKGIINIIMSWFSSFLLWIIYLLLIGYGDRAATVHDYLYRKSCAYKVSRAVADRVFYNALRAEGIARWRAWIFYGGVRLGGFYAYKRK